MKLKKKVKEMLLQPFYFGLLISKFGKPHTTIKRWIDTDYKDLRLPESVEILQEVSGLSKSELFETEKVKVKV